MKKLELIRVTHYDVTQEEEYGIMQGESIIFQGTLKDCTDWLIENGEFEDKPVETKEASIEEYKDGGFYVYDEMGIALYFNQNPSTCIGWASAKGYYLRKYGEGYVKFLDKKETGKISKKRLKKRLKKEFEDKKEPENQFRQGVMENIRIQKKYTEYHINKLIKDFIEHNDVKIKSIGLELIDISQKDSPNEFIVQTEINTEP